MTYEKFRCYRFDIKILKLFPEPDSIKVNNIFISRNRNE